jgi:8-oxo-dGTP pyrophosphatase MutT (NUDIX family)
MIEPVLRGEAHGQPGLYPDAVRVIDGWTPPDAQQASVREEFRALLAAQPGAVRRDNPGAHVTASALIVNATLDEVLLCLHGRVHVWLQLGGHCEDEDATLAQAALREATEESGLGGLRIHPEPIDLDIHAVPCRYGPSVHYDVRFAALAPPDAQPVISEESEKLGWFAPDALPTPLGRSTDRLIAPALRVFR